MWPISNDYGLSNIGTRPLGDYTEQQRQLALAYELAQMLAAGNNGKVYANVENKDDIVISNDERAAALAYGLKEYVVPSKYDSTPLVKQSSMNDELLLGPHLQPAVLYTILRQIVEEV
jgi:hypothetical protein